MLMPSAYRDMARRLAALRLLQPALDANYRAVTAATYPWPVALPNTPDGIPDETPTDTAPSLL